MRSRTLAAAFCAALIACGGSSRSAEPPVSNAPKEPIVEEATAAGQPRIEILSVGAEPRQPLRLKPAIGAAAGADVVATLNMRSNATTSTSKLAFGWAGSVMSTGDAIRVEDHFDKVEMDGAAIEHGNVAFTYTLLPTAALASFDVLAEAPQKMDTALAASARQTLGWLVVFPMASVGVGARWRVEIAYVQAGLPVTMTVTSELVAREATHATLRGTMEYRAAPDKPVFIEGTGQFEIDCDLTRVVPSAKLTLTISGEVKADTTTAYSGDSTISLTPRR